MADILITGTETNGTGGSSLTELESGSNTVYGLGSGSITVATGAVWNVTQGEYVTNKIPVSTGVFNISGTLNLGLELSDGQFSSGTFFKLLAGAGSHISFGLYLVSGGTLNWRGGTIYTTTSKWEGTALIEDGTLVFKDSQEFRLDSINVDIRKLKIINAPAIFYQQYSGGNYKNITVINNQTGTYGSSNGRNYFSFLAYDGNSGITLENPNPSGQANHYAILRGSELNIYNAKHGSLSICVPWLRNSIDGHINSRGVITLYKQIRIDITDNSDNVLNGVRYYSEDTENVEYIGSTDLTGSASFDFKIAVYDNTAALMSSNNGIPVTRYTNNDDDEVDILLRKAGYIEETKTVSLSGNNTLIIDVKLKVDENYTSTLSTITEINTIGEIYDLIQQLKVNDLTLPSDLFIARGKIRAIKNGYSLVRDQTLSGSPVQIDGTQIKVKTGSNGLQKDTTADTLTGTIDSSFDGHTNVLYVKSNGKVDIGLSLTLETGISSATWGVWPSSQGTNTRTGIITTTASNTIEVTPGHAMYYIVDAVNAYRSSPILFTVGTYGNSFIQILDKIKKSDGSNIVPDSLTTIGQRIANTAIYNQIDALVDLKLPTDYVTDERWDATNNVWRYRSEDFKPFAYKVEQIQSSQASLIDPSTVRVDDYEFVLSQNSSLVFRQHADNIDCEINIEAWTTRREGGGNKKFYNDNNGAIIFSKGNPVIANVDFDNTDDIVDAILNAPYGTLADGITPLGSGTLGEHWYQFYPPEIIRQLLETTLNGTTQITRYQPPPGTYGNGTFGDALRKVLDIKAKTDKLTFNASNQLDAVAKAVEDKTGYSLTASQVSSLAVAIETAILNEDDGNAILASIKTKVSEIDWSSSDIPANEVAQAVWDYLLSSITNDNSIGKLLKNNVDKPISRSSGSTSFI